MFRRFALVAFSFSVVALTAVTNPAGATSANTVTGAVSSGAIGLGSVNASGSLTDATTWTATLFFANGKLDNSSLSFFMFEGMHVTADDGAVHKGYATATGSDADGTKATITISNSAITPDNVTLNPQTQFTNGSVQIRVW